MHSCRRYTRICFSLLLAAPMFLSLTHSSAAAPTPTSDHALLMQLAGEVAADHATIANLKAQLAAAQARPAVAAPNASSTTYGPFTVTGKDVYLTGYNLHIQSGSGKTDGTVNGYGNLILGYNEATSSPKRTGSHNLILGTNNSYSSYAGIVAGNSNTISGGYASVLGGRTSTASGLYATVSGGYRSNAVGEYTVADGPMSDTPITPTGNDGDTHSGYLVTFTGANVQIENGLGATDGEPKNHEDVTNYVTNGLGNLIIGYNETQASLNNGSTDTRTGSHNLILGDYNEYSGFGGMVGGSFDTLDGAYSGVVSGSYNTVAVADCAVLGGEYNYVYENDYATVSGGYDNQVGGEYASVSGGMYNQVTAEASAISGGESNSCGGSGSAEAISGGYGNEIVATHGSISGGQGLYMGVSNAWAAGTNTGNQISGDFISY